MRVLALASAILWSVVPLTAAPAQEPVDELTPRAIADSTYAVRVAANALAESIRRGELDPRRFNDPQVAAAVGNLATAGAKRARRPPHADLGVLWDLQIGLSDFQPEGWDVLELRQTGIASRGAVSIGVLCALHAPLPAAHGQDTIPVLVRVEDRTRVGLRDRVVVRDARTGLDHEIYRSQGHIPDQAAVSPDGRYLAFIEVVSQTGAGKRRLTVIERSGRIVRFLGESSIYAARGIREYLWCCEPDKLAVITGGIGGEGAVGESTTLPYGLSLIDVRTGAATPIAGLRFPVQMHWAPFDSSLYIKDSPEAAPGTRSPVAWPVYRYHVASGTLSRTAHLGVFLSPDGKYYFDAGVYEASRSFTLYQTANDQDITARLSLPRHHLGPEGGWMPGDDHVLIFTEKPPPQPPRAPQRDRTFAAAPTRTPRVYPDRWNVAVDAETGRVLNRFQGDIGVGWKTNTRALSVERRAGIELIPPRRP